MRGQRPVGQGRVDPPGDGEQRRPVETGGDVQIGRDRPEILMHQERPEGATQELRQIERRGGAVE